MKRKNQSNFVSPSAKTEKLTMPEEAKNQTELLQENHPEKVDNRLPDELPKLRKHGKVNNLTQQIPVLAPRFDSFLGFSYLDIS